MKQVSLIAGLLACLGFCGTVNATLIERDLNAVGDGLITFDDESSLEWLDLTETVGLSVNEVLTGPLAAGGWRHASLAETSALFLHGGAVELSGIQRSGNWEPANFLGSLLGITNPYSASEWETNGFHAVGEPAPGSAWVAKVLRRQGETQGAMIDPEWLDRTVDQSSGEFGHFLVRLSPVSVSEPTTLALVCSGLASIGLSVGRKVGRKI